MNFNHECRLNVNYIPFSLSDLKPFAAKDISETDSDERDLELAEDNECQYE